MHVNPVYFPVLQIRGYLLILPNYNKFYEHYISIIHYRVIENNKKKEISLSLSGRSQPDDIVFVLQPDVNSSYVQVDTFAVALWIQSVVS